MALVYCRETTGRAASSAGLYETEMQRTWRMKLSSRTDNVYQYIQEQTIAGTLPYQYAPHPSNLYATCRTISLQDDPSGTVYEIKATYSSKPLNQEEREKGTVPNPLDRKPRRWVERAEYDRATDKDRDGNAITTSAGTKFPEPAYVPASDFIIQVRQNVTSWVEWPETYNNKLNKEDLTIKPTAITTSRTYDAETVLFKYHGCSEPQEENGVVYVEIAYSLHVRPDGWQDARVDEDIYYKDGTSLKRIQVDGQDAVTPIPLNGSGAVLANPSSSNVVFRTFDIIEVVDMTELSILNT